MAPQFHSLQYFGTGCTVAYGASDLGVVCGAQDENRTNDLRITSGASIAELRSVLE